MFKAIREFRVKYNQKTPKQKWQFIFDIADFLKTTIGIRVLNDLEVNWFSAFCGICGGDCFISSLYTIFYYFKKDKFFIGLESTCLYGPAVSSLLIYWKTIGPAKYKVHNLCTFGGKYIYPNNEETSKFNYLCDLRARNLARNTFIIIPMMIFSYSVIMIGPAYAYIFKGLFVTPMASKLPFIEEESEKAFLMNLGHQMAISTVAMMGSVAIEIISCIMNNTIIIMPEIICLNIDELSEQITSENYNMSLDSKQKLRHILVQIQDYGFYIQEMVDVHYTKLLVAPMFFAYSITISIISQLILQYPAGYGSAMCCYVQLMIMCYMGNNVKNSNSKITTALYAMPWHYMDIPRQLQLCQVLNRAQNGAVLTIGPFAELNCCLSKKIYTVLACLLKFVAVEEM